ncbi:kinase-like domain-containing protein [Zopfochytrium polystomum]|nr:kinase-like domain-containing protein [Zopfochytrium polystomum]
MPLNGSPRPKGRKGAGLKISAVGSTPAAPGLGSPSTQGTRTILSNSDLSLPPQLTEITVNDIEVLSEIGVGNGGTVNKVLYKPTQAIMARKIIHIEANKVVQKQILRELQILKNCHSPYIVSFFGAFLHDANISICMEYMDLGSLDGIYKKVPLSEEVIAEITVSVLKGLIYLFKEHKIIHRDVKPSNILVNAEGQFKVADFGVSGEMEFTKVKTFVGTSAYMSPERIKGQGYSVQCDVWSLGITLLELAMGRFPFPADGKPLTLFEILQCIVEEPLPTLPAGRFSPEFDAFLARCLIKDDTQRPPPAQLISDPFCTRAEESDFDIKAWATKTGETLKTLAATKKATQAMAKLQLQS